MPKLLRKRSALTLTAFGMTASTLLGGALMAASATADSPAPARLVQTADATPAQVFRSTTIDDSALAGIGSEISSRSQTVAVAMAEAATPPPPTTYCPVPGSRFTNSWGAPRSGGRSHKGVDMMAPHGAPVLAPVSGTVRHSTSRLGGLGFYLLDDDGNEYFGTHMQSLGPIGYVEAGTPLGTVGSTGNASSSGPHLHFEVVPAGQGNVNPYPFTAGWCGAN